MFSFVLSIANSQRSGFAVMHRSTVKIQSRLKQSACCGGVPVYGQVVYNFLEVFSSKLYRRHGVNYPPPTRPVTKSHEANINGFNFIQHLVHGYSKALQPAAGLTTIKKLH